MMDFTTKLKKKYVLLFFVLSACASKRDQISIESGENNLPDGEIISSFVDSGTKKLPDSTIQLKTEIDKLIEEGWEEMMVENGSLPDCYNYTPKIGKVKNSLEVFVGSGTNVSIKVMDLKSDKCIRYVFINSGSTYNIQNIPEGKYYLKIAYGRNWYTKKERGLCVGKFIVSPLYEKGTETLDFNIKYKEGGYSIPSYRLELDVISTGVEHSFNSENISEEEFNN